MLQENAQVVLCIDESLWVSDQLVDILLNGRSTLGSLQVKWTNRGTLCFTVPGTNARSFSRTLMPLAWLIFRSVHMTRLRD